VLGINEYVGWYERRPQDADAMQWKSIWNKPLIVSEFGAAAQFGRHGDPTNAGLKNTKPKFIAINLP